MALTRPSAPIPTWRDPAWTGDEAATRVATIGYDHWADELVVRFANAAGRVAIVVPLATPDGHYANVLADDATGAVIGVQIDNLRAALCRFPHWAAAAADDPPPAAAARLVADVRALFDRYGVGGET